MSVLSVGKIKQASGRVRLAEFCPVATVRAIEDGSVTVPKGARGAVVHVLRDGAGYEVEIVEPFHAVIAARRSELTPL